MILATFWATWTPKATAEALVMVGWRLAVLVGVVMVLVKLLDALKAKWSK